MKSLTRGHFKAGIDSLRGAKWRNFWTMLGVIIGVASVITIVGIGEGIKQQITGQIHHLGKDLITVRPATIRAAGATANANLNLLSGVNITGSLRASDVTTIARTSGVSTTVPLSAVTSDIKGDNGAYRDGLVIGTTPDLPSLLNQSMAYGAFLVKEDIGVHAAVLGRHAADAMFNEDVPLGNEFTIHGEQFIVRGIFNDFAATPLSEEASFNNAIFIPYDVAQTLTGDTASTYEILAKPTHSNQTGQVVTALQQRLKRAHGGQADFQVLQQNQNLSASNSIVDLLTKLISGVAAISLLVGGIGIMNVMLVTVTERMHEIGIRKAIGATNRQILSQFIIESSVLSLIGGIIGIGLAFAIDLGLRLFTNLQPVISWQIVAIATGVSLAVGIIFGTIPALQAARKSPIDALRSQ
jgi:putative ABC transport system permease protein